MSKSEKESEFHRMYRLADEYIGPKMPSWLKVEFENQIKTLLRATFKVAYREGFNRAVKTKAREEVGV